MGQRWQFLDRFSRPLKIAIQVGILAVILAAIGTVGFVEYSAQPSFCTNCHIMEPYYESWASSSHNAVPCISCHYAPGIKAEAMGKLQAANQVVKYVTGAYGTKPWAEIEDAACLRSGCHSERKLEGEVTYRGVRFDHAEHLGELRRGKRLRCTSCHSQIVQGDHVTVTQSTCILCHFRDRPPGEPVAGCTGCHPSPPRISSPAGFVVDHPQYVEDLVSCIGCHSEVTSGSGEADRSRCFTCHNEPERIQQFDSTAYVHRTHIAIHNVECSQCHRAIEHRIVSLEQTFELDCRACHQGTHDEQRRLYAGTGGHGTEGRPSSMFLARVTCESCHRLPNQLDGHAEVQRAGEATCLSCHGVRYANILPTWQQEMERRVERVSSVVRAARERLGSGPVRTRARADSLVRLATENVEFVRRGKGAHNIEYSDELLRSALRLVTEAVEAGQLAYRVPEIDIGPPLTENVCLHCHLGVERRAVRFGGREFDHEPHVFRAGMSCSDCHTPLEQHGATILPERGSCDGCHHRRIEPINCATCHSGPGGAPERMFERDVGDFQHGPHQEAGLSCSECHEPPGMSATELRCESCHDRHHRPEVSCLSCHREGAREYHGAEAHALCSACHGPAVAEITRWSREVCTSCHADRTEHFAPRECTACHSIPPMGGAPARSAPGSGSMY